MLASAVRSAVLEPEGNGSATTASGVAQMPTRGPAPAQRSPLQQAAELVGPSRPALPLELGAAVGLAAQGRIEAPRVRYQPRSAARSASASGRSWKEMV